MLHVSQQIVLWLEVPVLSQVPEGHLGVLGPGFSSVLHFLISDVVLFL